MNTQYEEDDDPVARLMAETAEENNRRYGGGNAEVTEDDDPVARMMAEHAEENSRRYAGGGTDERTEDRSEAAAPAPTPPRVRIPTTPAAAAPTPAPIVEQDSFANQLADLIDGDEVGETPPSALAGIKRAPIADQRLASRDQDLATAQEAQEAERRKGQHRPGLRRAPRFVLTDEDARVIHFLSLVRFGTAETVSFLLGKEVRTVERRLAKLVEREYLSKRHGAASGALFTPTEFGLEEVDSPSRVEQQDFSRRSVKHTLAGANVLALLLSGTCTKQWVEELTVPNHPVAGHVLTEKQLRRKANQQQLFMTPDKTPWPWDAKGMAVRKSRLQSEWREGQVVQGASEERDAPWTYILFRNLGNDRWVSHEADLVLAYPRSKDSLEAQAIAVEVELHAVNEDKLESALKAYAADMTDTWGSTYGKVVWLCRDEKVAKGVAAGVKRLVPREYWPRVRVMVMDEQVLTGISFAHWQANLTPEQKAARDANLVGEHFSRGLYREERADLLASKAAKGGE